MTDNGKNIFVFVVCGSQIHIDTLHFSLKYLKHFSSSDIIVVTDSSRNEIPVVHENVIDKKTPDTYNNHQASIWLKTSLHKILPKGPIYCYLDSDVIAVDKNCDNVFGNYTPPVTFAADHCRLPLFSPYAVNCECATTHKREKAELEKAIASVVQHPHYPPDYMHMPTRRFFSQLSDIRNYPVHNIAAFAGIIMAVIIGKSRIKNDLWLDIKNKAWKCNDFTFPMLYSHRKSIRRKSGYRFSMLKKTWINPDGSPLAGLYCDHLAEAVYELTGTRPEKNWQHWNGGVFLFEAESNRFMDTWHDLTMKIFRNPFWKTRDQGSLIATVWELGLQNHNLLPEEYNFIADFFKPEISALKSGDSLGISIGRKNIYPKLIHVYHEFGNTDWDLWNEIVKRIP